MSHFDHQLKIPCEVTLLLYRNAIFNLSLQCIDRFLLVDSQNREVHVTSQNLVVLRLHKDLVNDGYFAITL